MTAPSELRLRSIFDLLTERFSVPPYQRGYRWESRQVEALLNDLAAFQLSSRQANPNTFYCLQPVVVRRRPENAWELVDGQQRLATIFLILGALRDIATMLKRGCFEITYEMKEETAEFLKQPTPGDQSIDKHYIYEADQAIKQWFSERDGSLRLRLLDCLTGPDGTAPNVRVIWYELDENQPPAQAFVRLNVGRIPLTSAELIRAQLLRSDREQLDPRDAQQIPQDWDLIERRLQDDGYWYFLQSGRSAPPARIEYLFDVFIRTKRADTAGALVDDPLATFLAFQALLDAEDANVWQIWQEFKKLTQTLEEWYEDRTLYHLVGFLVATATSDRGSDARLRRAEAKVLLDLLDARSNSTGTAFDRHLRRLAWKRFAGLRAVEPATEVFANDETLAIAANPKRLGARIGITAVLHTWGSTLTHHPHVHMIAPGGGLSLDGARWVASRSNFLLHVNVLSRLFRGKMLAMLTDAHNAGQLKFFNTQAGLADKKTFKRFIAPLRHIKWVVYCKAPFAGPKQVLRYLSRYTHRVAISNRRLVAADDAGVAFRWKDYRADGPARWKTMRLHPHEFIRRFLLHVLPRGFHRIRHYGLLASANRAESIATARTLLGADPPAVEARKQPDITPDAPRVLPCPCPHCGARMIVIEVFARGCEPTWRPTPSRIDTS